MKYIIMSEEEYNNLSDLKFNNNVLSTSGSIKLYHKDNKDYFVKLFDITEGPLYENELKTIELLMKYTSIINMPELVMPEYIIKVNDKIVGYMMPYIKSINLSTILKDDKTSYEDKIYYLKQVGIILDKMKNVRENTGLKEFYLNDIHEDNFIIDISTNQVMAVDLVAAKIGNNHPTVARYLTPFSTISNIEKYKKNSNQEECYIIPSENSEIYAYIVIILKFLSGNNINSYSVEEYNKYMDILLENGIDKDLIECFRLVISEENNINPYKLLDTLTKNINKYK